ncbi:MAG: histidine kinase [Bacteroidia bacterium]|nr:histidine kinase [Bacteroidia bacterium]
MLRQFYFFIVFTIYAFAVVAQEPYSIKINRSKGLPSDNVYNIFQDSKGFIWIGNEEGLTRYDGYEMKTYECEGQTSRAGSMIMEDKYGRIWYQNFDGYLYYVEHDSLKALLQYKPLGYLDYGLVNNRLFVTTQKGVVLYDLLSLKPVKTIPFDINSLGSCVCSNNKYYVIAHNIIEIDSLGNTNIITPYSSINKDLPGVGLKTNNEVVFYDTYNRTQKLFTLSDNGFKVKFNLPFKGQIQTANFTNNSYWFCTPKGVYGFNQNGFALNNNEAFFKSSSISSVLRDREGNYWFGTTNEGIFLVPDLSVRMFPLENNIHRLALNKDHLFASTANGKIFDFNLLTKTNSLFFNDGSNKQGGMLMYDSISNSLFFQGNNFYVLNKKGTYLSQSEIAIKSCCRIDGENIAFAASGMLGLFNLTDSVKNDWRKISFVTPTTIFNKNLQNELRDVHLLDGVRGKSVDFNKKKQTIYFATNTGVYSFSLSKKLELKCRGASVYAFKIISYQNRQLLLSTHGRLYEITDNEEIVDSPINQQLNNGFCKSMKLVKNFLFLTTIKGLNYIDLSDKNGRLCEVDISPGGEPISDVEIYNNELILASGKGIVTTRFKTNCEQNAMPLFVINGITVNSKPFGTEQLVKLTHTENNIEIHYSILTFKSVQSTHLYYKINDNAWEKLSAESRTLKLAALAPGDYTISFRIGENTNGIQNSPAVNLVINTPWWKTRWAISLFILIIFLVFIIIYKWQTNTLKKQNYLLQQKFDLEKDLRKSTLKSIKAQMNPHFFYNALNTIQSFIFSDDKRNASTYLSKFSKLTRTILEMSEKETVTLAEEIEALTLYLEIEKVRFDKDFDFKLEKQSDLNTELIKIPSMIIQPYVENAIKHGLLHKKGNKELELNFTFEKNILLVHISDNGIGRARSEELNRIKNSRHQSFATKANSTRLSILNKDEERVGIEYIDKKDELGNALGTDVLIRIPVNYH